MFTIRRVFFRRRFFKHCASFNRFVDLEAVISWYLTKAYDNEKYFTTLEISQIVVCGNLVGLSPIFPKLVLLYRVDEEKEMIYLISVKEIG